VWIAPVPIDDVFSRAETPVSEDGGPEGTDITAGILRDGDADDLDLGGVWLDPQPPGLDRDPAGQLDITLAQRAVLAGGRAHSHSLGPQVDVGELPDCLGNLGDRRHEPGAMLERPDPEEGVGAGEQDPPVLDPVSVMEGLGGRSLLAHSRNHSSRREWTPGPQPNASATVA
jgi:hypothetical protein